MTDHYSSSSDWKFYGICCCSLPLLPMASPSANSGREANESPVTGALATPSLLTAHCLVDHWVNEKTGNSNSFHHCFYRLLVVNTERRNQGRRAAVDSWYTKFRTFGRKSFNLRRMNDIENTVFYKYPTWSASMSVDGFHVWFHYLICQLDHWRMFAEVDDRSIFCWQPA